MKKLIFFTMTVCAMLITACTSSEEFESTSSSMESTRNAIRTKAEAIDIAIELMNGRFGSRGAYAVENVEIIGGESSRASEDTLIYAVNLADDRGFVLVSAAKAGDAILGYADNGSVVVDDIEPNSGFSFYMDAARNYVRSMQLDTIKVDPIPNPFIPVTIYEKVEPLAPQRWGQNYPEGMYCPNRLSGCGATAMALMLLGLKQPTEISYSYPGVEMNSEILNWAEIGKHDKSTYSGFAGSHLESCNASEDTHKTIGRICRELGRRANADYTNKAVTNIAGDQARNAISSLLPSNYTITELKSIDHYSFRNIFNTLKERNAVGYMRGEDWTNPNNVFQHAWVICGGERITTTRKNPIIGHEDETIITVNLYFFYNWGEQGASNGYFSAGVFDTSKRVTLSRNNYDTDVMLFMVYK